MTFGSLTFLQVIETVPECRIRLKKYHRHFKLGIAPALKKNEYYVYVDTAAVALCQLIILFIIVDIQNDCI